MIVSLAIFTVVAVVAAAALLRIVSDNSKAQSLQSAINNVSYVLDAISREMRTGTNFQCTVGASNPSFSSDRKSLNPPSQSCAMAVPSQNTVVAFLSSQVDPAVPSCRLIYVYRFNAPTSPTSGNATVTKAQQSTCGQSLSDLDYFPVFDVGNLTNFTQLYDFRVSVHTTTAGYSWAVFRLWGSAGERIQDSSLFDVETAVSQRIHD